MHQNYDLILVGTGFASSFFLKKFLEKTSKDKKVLVLERGTRYTHGQRLKDVRDNPLGYVSYITSKTNYNRLFINNNQNKPWLFDPNFGGSSNCWTGCTPRFLPNDFNMYSRYNVGIDWPIDYSDLEEYYSKAEDIMMISGSEDTPFPKSKKYPMPPHTLSSFDKVCKKKFKNNYIVQPTARASRPISNRGICCGSSVCHLCPVNAKFTIENGINYIYNDPRITLKYNAQVTKVVFKNNLAEGLLLNEGEEEILYKGEVIALGANAIFNAHILLNSGDLNFFTGKFLSEQLGIYVNLYLKDFDNVGGGTNITANGYMYYDGDHRKNHAACLIESHNDYYIRNEFNKWRHMARFKLIFEDLPSNDNKIETSNNNLKPSVTFKKYSKYAFDALDKVKPQLENDLFDLPIEKIEYELNYQPTESHILGTARMSKNSDKGVVDDKLIHHNYRNLYVLGGSSFPTITPSNLTLTIAALSIRSAELTI